MTDQTATPADAAAQGKTATLIYALYLLGFIVGITPLIGLVMAYVFRDGAPPWVQSHYRYQIRTFWLGLLIVILGAVTSLIFIGYFILLFWLLWFIVRCVKGLRYVGDGMAIPNPDAWLW